MQKPNVETPSGLMSQRAIVSVYDLVAPRGALVYGLLLLVDNLPQGVLESAWMPPYQVGKEGWFSVPHFEVHSERTARHRPKLESPVPRKLGTKLQTMPQQLCDRPHDGELPLGQ
jgi:hypothetical protein